MALSPLPGRGASSNPQNRFESTAQAADPTLEGAPGDEPARHPLTQFLPDSTRSILARNDSPDIPFSASINAYRGCEHGCIYCYARPTHEYLGMSAGLDFETRILVKHNAAALLRAELMKPSWQPQTIFMSGVTDCYQPIERKLRITRQILEVLAEFRNPVGIITKNHLVTRDIDILRDLAQVRAVSVSLSITTLRPELTRIMEPRTSVPRDRLGAIEALAKAGIPVGVMVAPIIPGLTDHEMPAILKAAAEAGATHAGYTILRLPFAVKTLFEEWVSREMPDRKDKILHRIRAMRHGKLNTSAFGERMRGDGLFAQQTAALFKLGKARAGIGEGGLALSVNSFRRPRRDGEQMGLFDRVNEAEQRRE